LLNDARTPPAGAAWSPDTQENYRLNRRFDRMGRLVGDDKMRRLKAARVMVVGLGGVGSWAAEALVRSGVGGVTLVDFDEVCVTNYNRQLHAIQGSVGRKKVEVMAERLRQINPACAIEAVAEFYSAETRAALFARRPDYVIDAIDHITSKCHLLASCVAEGVPIVTATGSGGRLDPTRIRTADLADTEIDVLAKAVRRILREKHGFPTEQGRPFGIPAVYSTEPPTEPEELRYDGGNGFRCVCPNKNDAVFSCDNRNLIMGNAGFVTGAFGLAAASVAVRAIVDGLAEVPARP
jgi:tRNA A37 threonylcarbamoyladenosine dehydratase